MDTSVPVPARITLGRFTTMHFVHNQEFGHVDRMFVAMFGKELGPVWQLEDIKGNRHQLTYNMDVNNPLLTDAYVRKCRFKRLELQGSTNTCIVQCKLLVRNSPKKSTKIGKGWEDFCIFNRLKEGDVLVFAAHNQMRKKKIKVYVKKEFSF
ncbi:hypothetical protein DEO72_LG10g2340 [Vigna unguiculata]|uniref:TF-B3 domain-containing protein n=1 Tax=Vigna unguiculata TaxID=3917 RepID=A0A4D6NGP6_VIGUN|nr:hypothetical protein DEO72_LG10g2340 [Vigna unguiculata]